MHALRKQTPKNAAGSALPWRLVHVTQGESIVIADPSRALSTVLGSCIAACVRDPLTGIGGMNHFLLPADLSADGAGGASLRYGVNAMEALLNQVAAKASVERRGLEIKVFGGANVQAALGPVGHRNADFIEEFLRHEGLPIAASHLRGAKARKVVFHPDSGKVMMRFAIEQDARAVVTSEKRVVVAPAPVADDIELFD
jgi:chemotaxis protein CheD